jgi:hypothetical protein
MKRTFVSLLLALGLCVPALAKGNFVSDPMFSEAKVKAKNLKDQTFIIKAVDFSAWEEDNPKATDKQVALVEESCRQFLKGFKDALKRDDYLSKDAEAVVVKATLVGIKFGPKVRALDPTPFAERGVAVRLKGTLDGKPAFKFRIDFFVKGGQDVDEVAYQAGYPAGRRAVFLSKGDGLEGEADRPAPRRKDFDDQWFMQGAEGTGDAIPDGPLGVRVKKMKPAQEEGEDEEAVDEKPAKKPRKAEAEDMDEEKPRKAAAMDEDEEDAPKRRASMDDEEDAPRKRRAVQE